MDGDDQGLETLLPDRRVELEQGAVTVKPLRFAQLAQGAQHIDGVVRAAIGSGVLTEEGELNLSHLAGLIAGAGEHVNELILLCTYRDHGEGVERVDRAWLSTLGMEDGLTLAARVIEVNWRGSIVKKLQALGEEIAGHLARTGLASSSG